MCITVPYKCTSLKYSVIIHDNYILVFQLVSLSASQIWVKNVNFCYDYLFLFVSVEKAAWHAMGNCFMMLMKRKMLTTGTLAAR